LCCSDTAPSVKKNIVKMKIAPTKVKTRMKF